MPLDAMPEHLNSPQEIDAAFPDDEQFGNKSLFGRFYRWINKKTKTWFAFSYRCKSNWARWRKYPKTLVAIGGKGEWRLECGGGIDASELVTDDLWGALNDNDEAYLSRIQLWKRWHFSVQWPLLVTFHCYFNAREVPEPTDREFTTDGKLLFFYWNHFDADLVYFMFTSIYVGLDWK